MWRIGKAWIMDMRRMEKAGIKKKLFHTNCIYEKLKDVKLLMIYSKQI